MKTALCVLLLGTARLFAVAPDSLAGKAFHDYHLFSGISNAGDYTVIFGADGRGFFLRAATGEMESAPSAVIVSPVTGFPDASWGGLGDAGADTSFGYRYEKTSDTTGVVTYIYSSPVAEEDQQTLYFDSPTTGSDSPNGTTLAMGRERFFLTDLLPGGATPAMANISSRGQVAPGHPLIVGLVVPGTSQREVLIRVIGPTLATFGVTNAWTSSSLQVYRNGTGIFGNSFRFPFWSDLPPRNSFLYTPQELRPTGSLQKIFNYVGAFALPVGSKDSAVVLRLSPGNYTVVADAAAGDPGGEALIEVYPLP